MARGRAPGFESTREEILAAAARLVARQGYPGTSMNEVAETIALIRDRVATPMIVDADNGYGNALNMQRTIRISWDPFNPGSLWEWLPLKL